MQRILGEIDRKKKANAAAKKQGAKGADPASPTAEAMVNYLSQRNDLTIKFLARKLGLKAHIVHAFAERLEEEGMVSLGRTPRGSTYVHLIKKK